MRDAVRGASGLFPCLELTAFCPRPELLSNGLHCQPQPNLKVGKCTSPPVPPLLRALHSS